MKMRFRPREGMSGLTGTINCGPGGVVKLSDEIETTNPHVQQTLSQLRTTKGRVLDGVIVQDDGTEKPVEVEPDPEPVKMMTPAEAIAKQEQQSAQTPQQAQTATPNAQGYDGLPDNELKTLIAQHGKPVPENAQHAELVQILNEIGA